MENVVKGGLTSSGMMMVALCSCVASRDERDEIL